MLVAHAVQCDGARANLFRVAGGYAAPVVFGPQSGEVLLRLRGMRGVALDRAAVLHPGHGGMLTPLHMRSVNGSVVGSVPLERGCAMVWLPLLSG